MINKMAMLLSLQNSQIQILVRCPKQIIHEYVMKQSQKKEGWQTPLCNICLDKCKWQKWAVTGEQAERASVLAHPSFIYFTYDCKI